ncbi:MAG TPA: PEGA domain-containing protein [Fibrobacteraceae bacterium]|nr:PEGA domain-containing protein [Fibrobacteraceae bacterium]
MTQFYRLGIVGFLLLVCILNAQTQPPPLTSSSPLNIAVGDFENKGVPASDAAILADRLRSELVNIGTFRVMERSQMDAILQEQSFQQSGCTSSECQVHIGQLLGVDRMIVGVMGLFGGNVYTVSARMLDVATGEVLFTVNEDYQGPISSLLSEVIPKVAKKLCGQTLEAASLQGRTGDLFVETKTPGATVLLDGQPVAGVTPLTLQKIPAGKHTVEARLDEKSGSASITLSPDDLLKLHIPLKTERGSLKVFSNPIGASVSLDGRSMGKAPLKLDSLKTGKHVLRVELEGYLPQEDTIAIQTNGISTWNGTLHQGALLDLSVYPAEAQVFLGVSDQPETVLRHRLLEPGQLTLRVESPGYTPWKETLTLDVGKELSRSIVLTHSQQWQDSLKHLQDSLNLVQKSRRKMVWHVLTGAVAVGGGAYAAWQAWQVRVHKENAQDALDDYDNATSNFEAYKATYDDEVDMLHDAKTQRNIGSIIAGLGVLGFGLTFVF